MTICRLTECTDDYPRGCVKILLNDAAVYIKIKSLTRFAQVAFVETKSTHARSISYVTSVYHKSTAWTYLVEKSSLSAAFFWHPLRESNAQFALRRAMSPCYFTVNPSQGKSLIIKVFFDFRVKRCKPK